jgi:hypothetical protein
LIGKQVQILSPKAGVIPFESVIKIKPYLASYGQNATKDGRKNPAVVNRHRPVFKKIGYLIEG